MKNLLLGFGGSLIFLASMSFAKDTQESKADRYSSFFSKGSVSRDVVSKVSGSAATSVAAETQALFLMAGLASVEGMKQQMEISGIKKETVTNEQLAAVATSSANELIQRSDTWAGLNGMLATNAALKKPMEMWHSIIANTGTNALFKEVVAGASANLVGFVGFEAGSELWHRAQMMLPNEEDQKRASKLWPMVGSAFYNKDSVQSTEDKALLGKVMNNMYTILVKDDELREKWWSFVMRNRVQTGNFMVGVSAMTAGSVIGGKVGSCFPLPQRRFAVPALGAVFGLASGVGASFVPKKAKDSVTRGLQSTRMWETENRLNQAHGEVFESVYGKDTEKKYLNALGLKDSKFYEKDMAYIDRKLDTRIANLEPLREELLTTAFDRVHLLNSRLYAVENKIQLAKEHDNPKAIAELTEERDSLLALYKKDETSISQSLDNQIDFLQKMQKASKDKDVQSKISKEMENVVSLKKWVPKFITQVRETSTWGHKNDGTVNLMSEQENQRLLEKFYLWGFKEKPFVETMDFNN